MKKILSFVLLMAVLTTVFTLAGCSNKPKNLYADLENFDSFVSEDADILGTWKETSTADESSWTFFNTTTLHMTQNSETGSEFTTVCAYNYDQTEQTLKVYVCTTQEQFTYKIDIKGINLTLTPDDGSPVRSFEKIK